MTIIFHTTPNFSENLIRDRKKLKIIQRMTYLHFVDTLLSTEKKTLRHTPKKCY